MTIGSIASRVTFNCDGATTVFPVPLQAYLAIDFVVILTAPASAGGAETTLVLNSNYTLAPSGSLSPTAWTMITIGPALAIGYTLQVFLNPVQTQQTNYVQGQAFPSAAVQANVDRLTQMVQRLQDQLNRSIRAPDGDVAPGMLLPLAIGRANLAPAFDANGNLSLTGIPATAFTQANFNAFLSGAPPYIATPQEILAGVTVVNDFYPPGHVDRYGTNSVPGTSDMTAAFQAAINQARVGGADVVWGNTGICALSSGALDCTFTGSGSQYGLTFRQIAGASTNLPSLPTNTRGGILVTHGDYTVFDLTGCNHFTFHDLTLVTNIGGTYPKTCFLSARNSSGGSILPRFINTTVVGYFSLALLYNYGSEDGIYLGNFWGNYATDATAKLLVLTSRNNILTGGNGSGGIGMASTHTTIFSGAASCIDHQFIGGQLLLGNPNAAADLFYLDAAANLKVWGPWMANGGGRSFFYCDMTNGPTNLVRLNSLQGEVTSVGPSYGVLFSNLAGTVSVWNITDTYWKVATASLAAAGATPVIDNLRIWNLDEFATKGIIIPGTLQNSVIEYAGIITLGTSTTNFLIGSFANMTIGTRTRDMILDRVNGALMAAGSIGIVGNAPPAQLTGWGTPTAGTVVSNFPGSGATLAQCGEVLTELILQLQRFGLLGA